MRNWIDLVENSQTHIPSPAELSQAILALTQKYIADGEAPNAYQINNGLCEDFAEDIVRQFAPNGSDQLYPIGADNFSVDGDGGEWDVRLIKKHWPKCFPTHGLTWKDIRYDIPGHIWIVLNKRHYDAECPEGVDNFFDLPLIRRGLQRMAGLPTDDDDQ